MESKSEKALMPLSDLRYALKDNGVVDVPRSTIKNWYILGVSTPRGIVFLKTRKVGRRRMSSVQWVRDFLEDAK